MHIKWMEQDCGVLIWDRMYVPGAATTNFLVFDFDGDGCAEICCKTGDGTVDGLGHRIGDAQADWRTWDKKSPTYGKIVNGPEYLTVFEGRTGKELDSKEYIPTRYPLDGWGGVGGRLAEPGEFSKRAFYNGKNGFNRG